MAILAMISHVQDARATSKRVTTNLQLALLRYECENHIRDLVGEGFEADKSDGR
jgi:hypothetical protein